MGKVVYLLRHSDTISFNDLNYPSNELQQLNNEKLILSETGEKKAKILSEYKELENVEIIFTSAYVRTMATAKYLALKNNLKLNIDRSFDERKFGVLKWEDLPENFSQKQIYDWDYKTKDGESLNEVKKRMYNGLIKVLKNNKNILIVSHGMAITCLLSNFCELEINGQGKLPGVYFKGDLVFDGKYNAPELFKLEFDDLKLVNITNIKGDWCKS